MINYYILNSLYSLRNCSYKKMPVVLSLLFVLKITKKTFYKEITIQEKMRKKHYHKDLHK